MMLLQYFLPAIYHVSSEFFIFQQDSAWHTRHLKLNQSTILPITLPDVDQFKKIFQSRLNSKFVIK